VLAVLGCALFLRSLLRLALPWLQGERKVWQELAQLRAQRVPEGLHDANGSIVRVRSQRPAMAGVRAAVFAGMPGTSRRRLRQLEVATPDLLSFLARALRAGHSLHAAIHWAGESFPGPLGEECARISAHMRCGVEMHQALEDFVARYPLGELRMFAAGLRIAEELGGPLPALLEQLARQTRLRLRLRARVKALSAEARWSAWFLGALPFVLALILSVWRPEHMAVLWQDDNGKRLVALALALMALGGLWMRHLVARVEG